MTGYSICVHKIYLKYLCKKYLINCNIVLIILKLLTINEKAMQYTYLKKRYARVNYNTHYPPPPKSLNSKLNISFINTRSN